jgi:hypothetical protein
MISARTARIDDNLRSGTDGSNPLPSAGSPVRTSADRYPLSPRIRLLRSIGATLPMAARSSTSQATSHRHRLEENIAGVSLKISADTEAALLRVFAPGAASGYPENHLVRLGI